MLRCEFYLYSVYSAGKNKSGRGRLPRHPGGSEGGVHFPVLCRRAAEPTLRALQAGTAARRTVSEVLRPAAASAAPGVLRVTFTGTGYCRKGRPAPENGQSAPDSRRCPAHSRSRRPIAATLTVLASARSSEAGTRRRKRRKRARSGPAAGRGGEPRVHPPPPGPGLQAGFPARPAASAVNKGPGGGGGGRSGDGAGTCRNRVPGPHWPAARTPAVLPARNHGRFHPARRLGRRPSRFRCELPLPSSGPLAGSVPLGLQPSPTAHHARPGVCTCCPRPGATHTRLPGRECGRRRCPPCRAVATGSGPHTLRDP